MSDYIKYSLDRAVDHTLDHKVSASAYQFWKLMCRLYKLHSQEIKRKQQLESSASSTK